MTLDIKEMPVYGFESVCALDIMHNHNIGHFIKCLTGLVGYFSKIGHDVFFRKSTSSFGLVLYLKMFRFPSLKAKSKVCLKFVHRF